MKENLLHIRLSANMQKNVEALGNILKTITPTQAMSWRDGDDGWTILEVVCHLRDYDGYFLERGELMLASDHPTYPVYDHLALVVERAYNEQDLTETFAVLSASRERFVAFFNNLTEEQWQRTGNHVDHGRYTVEALAAHVSWHDANHLEQITCIISQNL